MKIFFSSFLLLLSLNSFSQISEYIFPNTSPTFSNYGGLGVIQLPNARFLDEGSLAFSWTHNDPYLRGSVIAYPFNWLEASFQYTDINNALYSDSSAFSGSQSLKDKSFDIKLRLLKEQFLFPQVAIGIRDIGGTGLFTSEYMVASKRISNFDLSLGLGWGNLGNNGLKNPLGYIKDSFYSRQERDLEATSEGGKVSFNSLFTGPMSVFAGIEVFLPNSNGARLKLEFDTTDYQREGRKPLVQDSKINIGYTKPMSRNFDLKLSYTKGNTLSFGFSYKLPLGSKHISPKKTDKHVSVENSQIVQRVASRSNRNLYRIALKELIDRDIILQYANAKDGELHVAYAQSKYSNYAIATQRTLRVLDEISPDDITKFKVTNLNAQISLNTMEVSRDSFRRGLKIKSPELAYRDFDFDSYKLDFEDFEFRPSKTYPVHFFNIEPDLRAQIGGPDGFFFGDLRLSLQSELIIAPSLSLFSNFSYGLTNNYADLKLPSDSILPHVRTDIVDYMKEGDGFIVDRMQLNYFSNPFKNIYTKLTAGILEQMFGGVGGEILYRPYHSNMAIGADLFYVRQRDFNQLFDFQKYDTFTGHLTLYLREPNTGVLFQLKGGRYLAKDSGFTFDFSRRLKTGIQIGAFFSLTDISDEEFGEGSFDKGFYFNIPIDLFSPYYVKRNFAWGLRPVTRDGAQTITQAMPLWGMTDQANYWNVKNGWWDFYE